MKKRRRRWGKGIALVVAVAAALAAYGRLFFSAGVEVGGSFLERQPGSKEPHEAVYREFPAGISATVTGEKTELALIVFRLPDGGSSSYSVQTARKGDSVSASILAEDGGELFQGVLAGNGVWTPRGEIKSASLGVQNPEELVTLAAGELQIRGRWGFFLTGLLLFTVFGLNMKFSVFYYVLVNVVVWKRPKPLEFCMALQSVFHILIMAAGLLMLVLAVTY